MSDTVLGQMPPPIAGRDATHVAVVPLEAATILYPAQRVRLLPDGRVGPAIDGDILGIVDPFLSLPVAPGARPYVCLMPRSVTGLRHVYEHPLLDKSHAQEPAVLSPVDASRKWVEQWGA